MTENKAKRRITKGLLYLVFALVIIFFLFPILWTLSLSFKTVPELYKVPPALLPESIQIENYTYLVEQVHILRGVANSVIITAATIAGTMLIAVPAAYAFSRFRFKGSRFLQFLIPAGNRNSAVQIFCGYRASQYDHRVDCCLYRNLRPVPGMVPEKLF